MKEKGPIRRFFGFIYRTMQRIIKAVQVLVFLVVFTVVVSALSNLSGGGVEISESTALIVNPVGVLAEQAEGEPLDRAVLEMQEGPSQTVVRNMVRSIEYAADDARIKTLVLLPGDLQGGGLSKHQDIAAAIMKFRESGKPVVAMADSYNQSQYYLAAHADEIYMHDFGFVLIEGFGYYKAYFADAIEKLKVDVNVFRVGEFKSFVEPYLRNDMSDEDRLAAERWLQSLWATWQNDVEEARGIEPAVFDQYINNVVSVLNEADGHAGQAALNAGLVDGLMSYQQFRDLMIERVGVSSEESDTFEQIHYEVYLGAVRSEKAETKNTKNKIAVIVASGEIVDGEASPGVIGSSTLTRLIRDVKKNDDYKAVVLRVDSPGGSMFASEVIFDQLEALKETGRPLVASMGSTAASGGYYISMGADEIWASEATISGSIGVGAVYPTFQRSLNSLGVNIDGFGTTALSGQLSPARSLGDEARQLLEISVQSAYDVFISKVALSRDIDLKRVDELAQGRVWVGEDAYSMGLVDAIGGVEDAIASAATMAGLDEDNYKVVYVKRELSFAERLLLQYARLLGLLLGSTDVGEDSAVKLMRAIYSDVESELSVLTRWNDPRGIYYHCMCEL